MKKTTPIERTLAIRKEMKTFNEYLKKINQEVRHNLLRAEKLLSKLQSIRPNTPVEQKRFK